MKRRKTGRTWAAMNAHERARWLNSPEAQLALDALSRRQGDSAEDRLRWVVDFARRDLSRLRPEERIALGHDLRWIAFFCIPDAVGIGPAWGDLVDPMPDRRLRAYQREIAAGLRALVGEGERYVPWRLAGRPVLARAGDRAWGFALAFLGDERTDVLGAVATLLLKAGDRLRACRQCRSPFVARENRQRYCNALCSQRMRNTRRKPRPRKGVST